MPMGIGTFLPREAVFKRRYRWTLSFGQPYGAANLPKIQPIMVTVAARPSFTMEETELNFMNERAWISARPTWDPMSVTFLDFGKEGGNGADKALQAWIRACYVFGDNFADDVESFGAMSDPAKHYKRDGELIMWNGIGQQLEHWRLYGCWIQQANYGDLDMAGTEIATIEAQIRFDNAAQEIVPSAGGLGEEGANPYAAFEAL